MTHPLSLTPLDSLLVPLLAVLGSKNSVSLLYIRTPLFLQLGLKPDLVFYPIQVASKSSFSFSLLSRFKCYLKLCKPSTLHLPERLGCRGTKHLTIQVVYRVSAPPTYLHFIGCQPLGSHTTSQSYPSTIKAVRPRLGRHRIT